MSSVCSKPGVPTYERVFDPTDRCEARSVLLLLALQLAAETRHFGSGGPRAVFSHRQQSCCRRPIRSDGAGRRRVHTKTPRGRLRGSSSVSGGRRYWR